MSDAHLQSGAPGIDGSFVPRVRDDLVRRIVGIESVIWSPTSSEPAVLDPIATVMLEVIDGEASIDDLVSDVQDVVGVSHDVARAQVLRVIQGLDQARALVTSINDPRATQRRELFMNPPST